MDELIQLVKQYQRCKGQGKRLQIADQIVVTISPQLGLFISLRVFNDSALIDDILQESLIAIALKLDVFEGNDDSQFYAYCYTVCRNKTVDALRRSRKIRAHEFTGEKLWDLIINTAIKPTLTENEREMLREALELLAAVRPPCLEYLLAHYVIGMTYEEMAAVFGFPSADAAGIATRRCLRLARELLEE